MKTYERFEIAVIGAGHAGCEAALAAARMGHKVILLAINVDKIAHMPCNPSIGGIGKGQLVREIDALGGEMGRNIDRSMVQIKTLNISKGPAVQALRAQADRRKYSWLMKRRILEEPNLTLRQAEVVGLKKAGEEEFLLKAVDGRDVLAGRVIVATGTFLKGVLAMGSTSCPGGRVGEMPSNGISGSLGQLGIELGRFQSATPPRILERSVANERMSIQPGDTEPVRFSFESPRRKVRQRDCYLTYTGKKTNDIITRNLHLSPIKSGSVSAKGPRYCPSIERKVINFPDRMRHPVFVEPEGWQSHELYLQGLTTSMPVEIQEKIIQSVPGLEEAIILRPGYAVSYDYVLPYQLKSTYECAVQQGLYTAGQINGTSGYEEAAAQGLLAGINAALSCEGKEPLVLTRSQAYIGVLTDDIVTKESDEPYRMFTSRAEHRLLLRSDNADARLTPLGYALGLISDERMRKVSKRQAEIRECLTRLESTSISLSSLDLETPKDMNKNESARAKALLKRPEVSIEQLKPLLRLGGFSREVRRQAEIEVKYEGYIKRQKDRIAAQKRLENTSLPVFDYESIGSLSNEARQKLTKIKPQSLGQAARIQGVTPADISILMIHLEQCQRT